jgi:hypothetical protein
MAVQEGKGKLYSSYTTLKMREINLRRKQRAVDYKGGQCDLCGYSKCVGALEFHHQDPGSKDFGVSSKKTSWEEMKRELDKCSILCANCHREEHDRLNRIKHDDLREDVRKVVKERPRREKVSKECLVCGRSFFPVHLTQRFCSRTCKSSSQYRISWPSDSDLQQLLASASVLQVACDLGVDPKTLRERCGKRGLKWRRNTGF